MARKSEQIKIRVTPEHKELLESLAAEEDISISEAARSLFQEMIDLQKTNSNRPLTLKDLQAFKEKQAALDKAMGVMPDLFVMEKRAVPKRKGRGIRRVRA